jgi:hypothetical protein
VLVKAVNPTDATHYKNGTRMPFLRAPLNRFELLVLYVFGSYSYIYMLVRRS